MTFEHMTFEEINTMLRDEDFDMTSEEWLSITKEIGKLTDSFSEEQKKEIRESFLILGNTKTKNFKKSSEERKLSYERLKQKYPQAFIYDCCIDDFKEGYSKMLKQGSNSQDREEYIMIELMFIASNFYEAKILDRSIKKYPELDLMFFKNLHDSYYSTKST